MRIVNSFINVILVLVVIFISANLASAGVVVGIVKASYGSDFLFNSYKDVTALVNTKCTPNNQGLETCDIMVSNEDLGGDPKHLFAKELIVDYKCIDGSSNTILAIKQVKAQEHSTCRMTCKGYAPTVCLDPSACSRALGKYASVVGTGIGIYTGGLTNIGINYIKQIGYRIVVGGVAGGVGGKVTGASAGNLVDGFQNRNNFSEGAGE